MKDFPERNELVKKYNAFLGTLNLAAVQKKMEAKLKHLSQKADDVLDPMVKSPPGNRINAMTVMNPFPGGGSKLAIFPNPGGGYDLSLVPTFNFRVPPRLQAPTYMKHTLFVNLHVDENFNVLKTKSFSYMVNGAIRKVNYVPSSKNTPLKKYLESAFLGVMLSQAEKDLKDATKELEYEKKTMRRTEGVKFETLLGEAHPRKADPEGEMFKDKHGHLWLVVGGSKASPLAISFDPKWGQLNSMGTFGNDIDNWIPWTNMVKKAMVKKFAFAIEMELSRMEGGGRGLLDSKWQGEQALKYLKYMGR